jgi:MFS family permease
LITVDRVRLRASGIFYGWWIVAGAFLIQVLQTGLLNQSFGSYASVLHDEFGWSKTALSLAVALQSVESGLGPLQGWLIDRFGPRAVMRGGVVMFSVGFMLFSRLDSLAAFYVTFVLTAVGASFSGFMTTATMVVNWFERRRSLAMGLMQTGQSVGGFIVPLVAWSLEHDGWRQTAFASGILVFCVIVPLTFIMRRNPEEFGLRPDGATDDPAARTGQTVDAGTGTGTSVVAIERRDFTSREALRTRAFWFLSFGHALALVAVSAVSVHLVLDLVDEHHYSLSGAATVVAFMTGVMMIGRICGGILGDRFEKRIVAACAMAGHASAVFVLAHADTTIAVGAFAVLHGLSWGIRGPLMHAMRADYFGRRAFATIMGFSSMVLMVGNIAGPLVVGVMTDYFGSYRYGFSAVTALALLGSAFFILAKRPAPPVGRPRLSGL